MTQRIGILGGTFDPPHIGHLVLAVQARHQLGLTRVLMVVANEPWQKIGMRRISAATDRWEMLRSACTGYEGLEPSDIELRRGGVSYSIDTVEALAAPERALFLIVGADVVDDLTTWQRWEDLAAATTLAVASRRGAGPYVGSPGGWRHVRVRMPALDVSSTELRHMAAGGLPLDGMVPISVASMVRTRGLYRNGTG